MIPQKKRKQDVYQRLKNKTQKRELGQINDHSNTSSVYDNHQNTNFDFIISNESESAPVFGKRQYEQYITSGYHSQRQNQMCRANVTPCQCASNFRNVVKKFNQGLKLNKKRQDTMSHLRMKPRFMKPSVNKKPSHFQFKKTKMNRINSKLHFKDYEMHTEIKKNKNMDQPKQHRVPLSNANNQHDIRNSTSFQYENDNIHLEDFIKFGGKTNFLNKFYTLYCTCFDLIPLSSSLFLFFLKVALSCN